MSKDERQVRYNHIEDIKLSQSIFGRFFGFGTVIPLTGTGLGTGTDEAMLASGVGSGSNKVEFRNGTTGSAPVEFTIFTAAQGTYVGINRRFEAGIFADCDGSAEVTVVFK